MTQRAIVDNAEKLGQLIAVGWDWIGFTGDGNWMLYELVRSAKPKAKPIKPEDVKVE